MEDAITDFKAWYFSKPIFTRTYLAICVGMTLLTTLGILSGMQLFYTFKLAFLQFNIWRPFTALFFMGKFDFGLIFNLYFAFIALNKVETQIFSRERYPDFLWLAVFLFLGCFLIGSIFTLYFFSESFLMGMMYIWCKRLPHEEITFMFGFRVKSGYFPFVYAIAMTLFGGNFMNYIFGIMIGHAYIFIKDIALIRYHKDYFPTPLWLSNWWFGRNNGGQSRAGPARGGGFFAGQGVRLG